MSFMTLHHSQEVPSEYSIPPRRYPVRGLLDGPQNICLHETLMFLSFWFPQRAGMTQGRREGRPWSLMVALLQFPLLAFCLTEGATGL